MTPLFSQPAVGIAPVKRDRRGRIQFKGTPRQQAVWVAALEKQIRREAKYWERRAARLSRLAEKIAAERSLGKLPSEEAVIQVVHHVANSHHLNRLLGLDHLLNLSKRDVMDALVPGRLPASPADPLKEATAIVRSAQGANIDWTREPLTDRERRIRERWIERRLEDVTGQIAIRCEARVLRLSGASVASDLAVANEKASAILEQHSKEQDRAEFQDIARELDDEAVQDE